MNTGILLLKMFSIYENYKNYQHLIKRSIVDHEICILLEDFGAYYETTKNDRIDFSDFGTWFHHYRHPDLPQSKHDIFKLIFDNINKCKIDIIAEQVLEKYQQLATAERLRVELDKGFDLNVLYNILKEYEDNLKKVTLEDPDIIDNDLDRILDSTNSNDGFKWRLSFLNDTIYPLSIGKFVIIGAGVNIGKTTFALSEVGYMAQNLTEGRILWLNNEQSNDVVYRWLWQSVLGCTEEVLRSNREQAKRLYLERMHGDMQRVMVVDIRKKNFADINSMILKLKPAVIVVDQADKISHNSKFFSDHNNLKNLYGSLRTIANEVCPVIAISQADNQTSWTNKETGGKEYLLYPHFSHLDGSKVGKPGEADVIIMIGRRGEEYPNSRGVYVCKNKFGQELKREVVFDGLRKRYESNKDE